jgi:diphthine synthase
MLYLIGLGLSDETDITVKGLSIVKKCARVYLEAYTSILLVDKEILVLHPLLTQTVAGADADT